MSIFSSLSRKIYSCYNYCVRRQSTKRIVERAESVFRAIEEKQRDDQQNRDYYAAEKKKDLRIAIQQFAVAKAQIRVSQRLNCLTGIAAFFAFFAALGIIASVIVASDATVESERAWIAAGLPNYMQIPQRPGDQIALSESFANVGRGPAFDIRHRFDWFWVDAQKSWKRVRSNIYEINGGTLPFPPNDTCDAVDKTVVNGVVWPFSLTAQLEHGFVGGTKPWPKMPPQFFIGKVIFGWHGCFKYRTTFGEEKFSRFCTYLFPQPRIPVGKWQWMNCDGAGQTFAD